MYLKSIEVQGFKSFANKITFKFNEGITGIVGPNGSGKSNVADAVRWVLGEQKTKQLRSSTMQDVIFAGTEMRKPLSYAFVAITLDNTDHQLPIDYDEVTVARRLYRSGESEYLINGSPCRLKDVNELFYDTGIGQEGYSIIGQGQIEKILSGKPEERRELFDEAAGIVKFKKRKLAAQKKLDDEKANLLRITDILAELEKQKGPLEKQSEVAKVYLKKRDELKVLDVNCFLLENNRLKSELDSVKEKWENASRDLTATTDEFNHIKDEYDRIQEELERLETAIEDARNALSDTGEKRNLLTQQIAVLKEQINSAQGSRTHLVQREETLNEEINTRREAKEEILSEKSLVDAQFEEISQKRAEAQAVLSEVQESIENLNFQIEVGKNQIIDALNERATIKSHIARIDSQNEQLSIHKAELSAKLLRYKTDEKEQEEALKALQDEFNAANDDITRINDAINADELKNTKLHDEIMGADAKTRELTESYHREKSRLEALSNITERYEGYGGSVKAVMEQKDAVKGIIGVVADLIKVDEKYETAIEIALGGNIQNVVTEDESTAKKLIEYLKESKAGRVTFLPLDSIVNETFKTPEVLKEPGAIGMASELVRCEARYKVIAEAMLGRIVVVDDVDHATKIARKYNYSIRMVTLAGELLVPGGAISGGRFKNNSNLLGRRREIEDLEKKVAECKKALDELNASIDKKREERRIVRERLEKEKSELQKAFLRQNSARISVQNAKEKMDDTLSGYDELKGDLQDTEKALNDLKEERQKTVDELAESEQFEKNVNEKVQEFQQKLTVLRVRETEESAHVASFDTEIEKINQQLGFHNQNIDRIDQEIMRYQGELSEILEAMKLNEEEVERKQQDIASIEATIMASHDVENDTAAKMREDIKLKDELSQKQKNFFTKREELSDTMARLDKEVFRLNSQKERIEESIESQISYMWESYEITLHDAVSLMNPEMTDLSGMKKEISKLKDEIKKLGDVNVNAIEAFKDLMERYTFLKAQHEDLIEAEKTLNGIIAELDEAMRKQFKEKFAEISVEFDKVFKELFGGGKGTLELMEEEDLLDAGIRIIAQPPGKKLQNMMQLSGGEKSLTAIALLFAIQNLKPSPFCLLDEIEAALDEVNVERFAKYLHKLTKNTQFIVITHRRGTMEKADCLYGITMQEKGVSALVSVSLIDSQLDD